MVAFMLPSQRRNTLMSWFILTWIKTLSQTSKDLIVLTLEFHLVLVYAMLVSLWSLILINLHVHVTSKHFYGCIILILTCILYRLIYGDFLNRNKWPDIWIWDSPYLSLPPLISIEFWEFIQDKCETINITYFLNMNLKCQLKTISKFLLENDILCF